MVLRGLVEHIWKKKQDESSHFSRTFRVIGILSKDTNGRRS
jgi:hypothetical protein